MLSKKSEQFLVELKMYLFSKGKNDEEILSVIEELEDHLLQAEADGKSMKSIVGNSPKAYMKSIGKSMPLDFRELVGLIPMTIILIASYFSFPYAISGQFTLSPFILIVFIIGAILGFGTLALFVFKGMPKLFHLTWKTFLFTSIINVIVTSGFVLGYYWWNKQGFQPTFVATPFQNTLILIVCILFFIISAIYMKTWINIIIPSFIAFFSVTGDFVLNGIIKESTFVIIYVCLFLLAALIYFIFKKSKKEIITD